MFEGYSQCTIHLLETVLGLLEEAVDDSSGEILLVVIFVHFKDLFEGVLVNRVSV